MHLFTQNILAILEEHFLDDARAILEQSPLLGYLNYKTKSANSGSKARGAFGNHYALYVVIEDYIQQGFYTGTAKISYSKYKGAKFSDLFKRQRELPFGAKLQNHALNARLNDEFKKLYPSIGKAPIIRNVETQRYWIQRDLLMVSVNTHTYNIAQAVLDIIDAYVVTKKSAFESFLESCRRISELSDKNLEEARVFIIEQLNPQIDARIFEIVSYAVLKSKFGDESIWIGKTKESVKQEILKLYKTGRTNANDGGIDFVMKPLGRFFQVTETVDVNKYFLDIDKVQRFPITFVVKSMQTSDEILLIIEQQANEKYGIDDVVKTYMNAIEGVITSNELTQYFDEVVKKGKLREVMNEIITQSMVEFNYVEDEAITQSLKEEEE